MADPATAGGHWSDPDPPGSPAPDGVFLPAPTEKYPVPMIVGCTGHRNLVDAETPEIREKVRAFLTDLQARFPRLPLRMLNPLAEGADRLAAQEAIKLGIRLIVPLPMPWDLYLQDFDDAASREEFTELCRRAEVIELPILAGATEAEVAAGGVARQRQYAQLGIFVSAHCHVLLALWDGREAGALGGTAQVVNFHHHDVMPGFTEAPEEFRMLLADNESDLVYQIVCSRDQDNGQPAEGLKPLETRWYTTEPEDTHQAFPSRYQRIFDRTSEFNEDYSLHAERIQEERYDLLTPGSSLSYTLGLKAIDDLFVTADWLAGHFQRRFNLMLWLIHTVAVLMGLTFIAYADVGGQPWLIYVFLCLFGVGAMLYTLADRNAWHRKYLDYRALAEGLRVQFFWSASGVTGGKATKFTHDNFLQKQDVELGWIRNVMRVGGLYSDGEHRDDRLGLEFAMEEWVGDDKTGQTGYYGRKSLERARVHAQTERIGSVCLLSGVLVAVILAAVAGRATEFLEAVLLVLMGILPLIAATRDAYAHKKAEKELIKQYQFMHRVFGNARQKLDTAKSDSERRAILKAVGDAALDEHAEWILMHRERPLEMGGL